MEECVKLGLCNSIGVSNFNCQMILDLLTYAKIPPAINQIELHPYNTQEEFIQFLKDWGIAITAYSPLTNPGGTDLVKLKKVVLDEPLIKKLAKKYQKSPGQIVLNWGFNREYSIITKSVNNNRIQENYDSLKFEMEGNDYKDINSLNLNERLYDSIINPQYMNVPVWK